MPGLQCTGLFFHVGLTFIFYNEHFLEKKRNVLYFPSNEVGRGSRIWPLAGGKGGSAYNHISVLTQSMESGLYGYVSGRPSLFGPNK